MQPITNPLLKDIDERVSAMGRSYAVGESHPTAPVNLIASQREDLEAILNYFPDQSAVTEATRESLAKIAYIFFKCPDNSLLSPLRQTLSALFRHKSDVQSDKPLLTDTSLNELAHIVDWVNERTPFSPEKDSYPSVLSRCTFAFNAIENLIDKGAAQGKTPADIIHAFHEMMKPETVPYQDFSAGFEVEFFARDKELQKANMPIFDNSEHREVSLGPFTNIDSAGNALRIAQDLTCLDPNPNLSTLHMNFGMNAHQLEHYKQHQDTYHLIIDQLSYMSNPRARNLKLQKLREIDKYQAMFYHKDITPMNKPFVPGEEQQVARLETKQFCLAPDADVDIVQLSAFAFKEALNDTQVAERLSSDLTALFRAGNLDYRAIPSEKTQALAEMAEKTLEQRMQPAAYELEALAKRDAWEGDFGGVDKDTGELIGRQVNFRSFIREYLEAFVQHREAQAFPKILQEMEALNRAWHEEEATPTQHPLHERLFNAFAQSFGTPHV